MRGGVFLLLERTHAEHQPGDAVVLVDLDDPVGKPHRLLDVALGQHREEGALEQFGVLRIGAQRRAVIGGGGAGVALRAGVARGEIAARVTSGEFSSWLDGNCAECRSDAWASARKLRRASSDDSERSAEHDAGEASE